MNLFFTLSQAADLLGVSQIAVLGACRCGDLGALEIDDHVVIARSELVAFVITYGYRSAWRKLCRSMN